MKTPSILLLSIGVCAVCLLANFVVGQDPATPFPLEPNPHVDYTGYARTVNAMAVLRAGRLVSEDEFLRLAAEPGTVILDARSARNFARRHVAGAVNLPYTEFTAEALARVIPTRDTRVLIYCNNNFSGDPEAFALKIAATSLNLATYSALTDYGYTNVWELQPYLDVSTTHLPLVGTPTPADSRGNLGPMVPIR